MTLHHMTANPTLKWEDIDCSAAGSTTIVAAVASKKIRIKSIIFTVSSAVTIEFRSAATAVIPAMYFDVYGGLFAEYFGGDGYFMETVAGEAFNMYLSGASFVRGSINYEEV